MLLEEKCNLVFVFLWKFRLRGQTQGFQNLIGGCLFVFVEYLCNRSTKIETKHFKNYLLILAIVNYRNWLDGSPFNFREA